MPNIRKELIHWIQIATIIVIWLVLMFALQGNITIDVEAIRVIPDVVFVYAILHFLFTTWMWRWAMFRNWLVPLPDVQGSWSGVLTSTWINPATGVRPEPVPVLLVVRQTFDDIAVTVHTEESTSVSTAASFDRHPGDQLVTVSYMYTNRPRPFVRSRSNAHDGSAVLRVVSGNPLRLQGEYWTARQTTGEIDVAFLDRLLRDSFSS